ncbi:MAG: helix-turn-helix domain-containing protein [Vicinamibacterales bacterium]
MADELSHAVQVSGRTTASGPWLTVREAAARARVGAKLIYREVASGRLRAARVGGRRDLRFRPEYVDAWLEASATPVEVRS